MIGIELTLLLWARLSEAAEKSSDPIALRVTAVCSGIAVVISAVGTIVVALTRRDSRTTRSSVGIANGRGDVVTMLGNALDSIGDVKEKIGGLEVGQRHLSDRLAAHQEDTSRRFSTLHASLHDHADELTAALRALTARVTHLEDPKE